MTSPSPALLGVYVHFPWCRSLCPYCDFPVAVVGTRGIPHEAYADAVLTELAERAPDATGRQLVSIYIGGGTPSLWQPDSLGRVIADITATFAAPAASLEITLEANPRDCTPQAMAAWQAAGINRLSIGVQSTDPAALVTLGRDHRQGDGMAALSAALAAGFARLSADIIAGVPGSRVPAVDTVRAAAATGVGHLSVYELTIEERTRFGRDARAGRLLPLDEDILAETYLDIDRALTEAGFEHYEISSYARPGQRAVHNQLYWTGAEFLGLGAGAASFCLDSAGNGERTTNLRSVHQYLRARGLERIAERTAMSPDEVTADRLWLGMRTTDGVPASLIEQHRPHALDWLFAHGLAERAGERIRPTLRGFVYSNQIAFRLYSEER